VAPDGPRIRVVNPWRREYLWPLVLVVLGVYFLLNNLGLLGWLRPEIAWPVLLILFGGWLIIRRART
jgi:Domain of unknown function (DUF5668)